MGNHQHLDQMLPLHYHDGIADQWSKLESLLSHHTPSGSLSAGVADVGPAVEWTEVNSNEEPREKLRKPFSLTAR